MLITLHRNPDSTLDAIVYLTYISSFFTTSAETFTIDFSSLCELGRTPSSFYSKKVLHVVETRDAYVLSEK